MIGGQKVLNNGFWTTDGLLKSYGRPRGLRRFPVPSPFDFLSAYCLLPAAYCCSVPFLDAGPKSLEVLVQAAAEEYGEVFVTS
jgi:hypothetical protein